MADFASIKLKQTELIRKGLDGSVFRAPITADTVDDSTLFTTGGALGALPAGYLDIGYLTTDGAQFSTAVTSSDINSWGSNTPTRTDITAEVTTLQVACQETKLATIGLYTGVDEDTVEADPTSGAVTIKKPTRPTSTNYRILGIAVDDSDDGEIYICRFLPRANVSDKADQALNNGDDGLLWGVTFTGRNDTAYGSAESYLFGGPGWLALLDQMGFSGSSS